LRSLIEPIALPVIRYATRSYIPGPRLADAMALAGAAAAQDLDVTIGYWNDGKEDPRVVADRYFESLDAIGAAGIDGYVAVKIPALHDRLDLTVEIVSRARSMGVRIIFDSHAPDRTDMTFKVLERVGPELVGCAIPGRWRRSVADADRAIKLGVSIRIVKGQWPDPEDRRIDLREGYLRIVDRVAGSASHVGVATHDPVLAREAIRRLTAAGTSCEQELVYPLPIEKALIEARAAKLRSRLYVPFGSAWLPYSVSRAMQNPRVVFWLLRDLFTDNRFRLPRR
jgi:proline dehydrogenase